MIPRGLVALQKRSTKYLKIISFTALVLVIDHPSTIKEGYTPTIAIHTSTVPCKFSKLINRVEKQSGLCYYIYFSFFIYSFVLLS